MRTINCTECNKPGGTVPKYHYGTHEFDTVKELLHDECAWRNIARYYDKKETSR